MPAAHPHRRAHSRRRWIPFARWIALGLLGFVALLLFVAALALPAYARWVDPRLEGTELESASDGLGSTLKVLLGKASLSLSAPADGTKPSGKIAVADDLRDPKLQLVVVLEKSVENSFLLSMQEALKRVYTKPPSETAAQAKPQPTQLKTKD